MGEPTYVFLGGRMRFNWVRRVEVRELERWLKGTAFQTPTEATCVDRSRS